MTKKYPSQLKPPKSSTGSVRKTPYDSLPESIKLSKPIDYRYVDLNYLSAKVQQYGIKSQRQYRDLVKYFKPGGFPGAPERVYDTWTNWNDFLHTDNRYYGADELSKLVPYWDAVAFVHTFNFSSALEYTTAFEEGKFPKGIPKNPHKRYSRFMKNGGWNAYLGKTVIAKVTAQQEIQQACALVYTKDQSPNTMTLLIAQGGITDLKEKLTAATHLQAVKIYNWYPENAQDVVGLLDILGNKQQDFTWIFPNPTAIFYELQNILEPITIF